MAEFLGARISLVSKSDIRYVGTLHEIDSSNSTVALENVQSFGTEGRRGNPDDEIPPNPEVYDYIVFRGTDVKDLRIEERAVPEPKPRQIPDDPAILPTGSRPGPPRSTDSQGQNQNAPPQQGGPPGPHQGPPFAQHPQYPPFFAPPPAGWGRGGPPGPGGFPGMPPFGAPPGWYPPPGQGFQQGPPGPFPPFGYPPGPPGQFPPQHGYPGPGPGQFNPAPKPAPIGPGAKQPSPPADAEKQSEPKSLAKPTEMPAAAVPSQKAPTPPTATKPSPGDIKAAVNQASSLQTPATPAGKSAPTGPKGRVQPALPLQSPAASKAPAPTKAANGASSSAAQQIPSTNLRDATQAAADAVAAAMAKLDGQHTNGNAVDHLTRKVNEMRTNDTNRGPRQPGAGAGFNQSRGGHRGGRGGAKPGAPAAKVDVPATDFDFESSNAKFNKQDLVKEAIAGSPLGENPPSASPEEVPVGGYNKSTSFFDNISSESRDRAEAASSTNKPGGREWRGEEQKKNVETFGQGSVDNGYRGGFRGRGRGRGRGFRGRGYGGRGGGGGGYRGDSQTAAQ